MAPADPCNGGLGQRACYREHVVSHLDVGPGGKDFRCIVSGHVDRKRSLSINPGSKGQRLVWCCHAGCDPRLVREALLRLGIDESCLGNYVKEYAYNTVRKPILLGTDAATAADARRFHAVLKLPADLNGELRKMCIQAIAEGEGNLPGDPARLLPYDRTRFAALARRAGVSRTYGYTLYANWVSGPT